MNTDQQTWKQACKRVGARRCKTSGGFLCNKPNHIPLYPPIGDSAATLAMLVWLAYQINVVNIWKQNGDHFIIDGHGEHTIPLALAAAVCALKRS